MCRASVTSPDMVCAQHVEGMKMLDTLKVYLVTMLQPALPAVDCW